MHIINITLIIVTLLTPRYIKMLKYVITDVYDVSAAKKLIKIKNKQIVYIIRILWETFKYI